MAGADAHIGQTLSHDDGLEVMRQQRGAWQLADLELGATFMAEAACHPLLRATILRRQAEPSLPEDTSSVSLACEGQMFIAFPDATGLN